ncbi:hypothetical protein LCGC14_3098810 [marine sediment metagenome]|uniref:Uncharacterized protein n=1 Tax=marine sediment metagenome TaxID=412755 RepID=A0A0F8YFT5_9ZZZZ
MPLNKDIENILNPMLASFDKKIEAEIAGQIAETYISGQAEVITWGKTKGGVPIAYEGPPISKAIDWAEKHGATLVTQMDVETKKRLAHTISQEIENKRGIPGISRDIRQTFTDMSKHRSELIARTETTHAQKMAASAGYRDSGVTEVMILDNRLGTADLATDPECINLNGKIVSLEFLIITRPLENRVA